MARGRQHPLESPAIMQRGADFYCGHVEKTSGGYFLKDPRHVGHETETALLEKMWERSMALKRGDVIISAGKIYRMDSTDSFMQLTEVEGAEIYFTGRASDGRVRPMTIDHRNPYFRGPDMAHRALDESRETDPDLTRNVKVYKVVAAFAQEVKPKKS